MECIKTKMICVLLIIYLINTVNAQNKYASTSAIGYLDKYITDSIIVASKMEGAKSFLIYQTCKDSLGLVHTEVNSYVTYLFIKYVNHIALIKISNDSISNPICFFKNSLFGYKYLSSIGKRLTECDPVFEPPSLNINNLDNVVYFSKRLNFYYMEPDKENIHMKEKRNKHRIEWLNKIRSIVDQHSAKMNFIKKYDRYRFEK